MKKKQFKKMKKTLKAILELEMTHAHTSQLTHYQYLMEAYKEIKKVAQRALQK